jgi:hypothetical protein
MKSEDIQTAVKNKYENSDGLAKIYHDLTEVFSLQTIKLWIKIIKNTGSIDLSSPPGCPSTIRTMHRSLC